MLEQDSFGRVASFANQRRNKIIKRLFFIVLFINLFTVLGACEQRVGGRPQKAEDVFMPRVNGVRVESWVKDLVIPWSLVFLDTGRALVSERPGRIRLIENGQLHEEPYALIEVASVGEAGLMGLALHPDFPRKPYIYAMHTYEKDGGLFNRVIRLEDRGKKGVFDRTILDDIPGGRGHDGGRIGFGPDGMLYIATGETLEAGLAQDLDSLGGKILRITPDGKIPDDNPFKGSPVYSYGHRNPQGIAWQPESGRMFESEHGPSGEFARFANDEINIIVKGGNYGWPKVIGAPGSRDYVDPIIVWKETTPPSGITFYGGELMKALRGDLFVATLKSEALIRIRIGAKSRKVESIERWFAKDPDNGEYGRLRDVVEGPDGAIYFLTSNRDGRGNPRPGDDKIYRIVP